MAAMRMTQPYETLEDASSFHLSEFQQEKVASHLKIVKWIVMRIVDRFSRLPPHIEVNDLLHSGILGLIDAVRRFSWGRQNEEDEFKAYAECRIRGQVIDELRGLDVLPRSSRDEVKKFVKAVDRLRQELKHEPTASEVAAALQVDIETYHHLRMAANFGKQVVIDTTVPRNDILESLLKKTINATSPDSPETLFHLEEIKKVLAEEIQSLAEREKVVISLYYYDELTLKEIGAVLSLTESRISQIHAQALAKLTRRFKKDLDSESLMPEDL